MDSNNPQPPIIETLLVIAQRSWAYNNLFPGGAKATQARIDKAQKSSVGKGEPVKPGPCPTSKDTSSSSSTAPKG
ncbi:benzoate 4-monooxygenase cytochrome P450 [Fusarium pseudocircinatum]|uniref:Benzoate 4-monooxygenase cytochrome P450 n=1 Tax=Fusarium pseudocircinatum TaxID=56676 RepID=A0A8H5PAL0_9HYPO|nr:benzoate 4-monooxygenase cytochrome P450 [Fusarium pseudocircinatum]